jgi:hypothetical protein
MKLHVGSVRRNRNIQVSVGTLDSAYTVTRAHTPATATSVVPNRSGTFVEYAQNVPRYNAGALLVEEARTNLTHNPRGEGAVVGIVGSGGAVPTTWAITALTNCVLTIAGFGTETGIQYVDVQFDFSAAGSGGIYFDALGGAPFTASGTYTGSVYARLVAGSMANITPIGLRVRTDTVTPSNSAFGQTMTGMTSNALSTQRYTTTATVPADATAGRLNLSLNSTAAASVTIRVGGPQLEFASVVTSLAMPVVGTPATAARAVDVITRSIAPTAYPSRNLYLNSEDFGNASWTKTNITVNTGTTAGPYTGTFGDALVSSAVTTTHTIQQSVPGGSFIGGIRYTVSVYAKAGTMNFMRITPTNLYFGGGASGYYFDLTTGAVTIAGGISALANPVATATNIGAGWWRCSLTFTSLTSPLVVTTNAFQFTPTTGSNSYLGDALEGGFLWGAQTTASPVVPAYTQTVAAQAASHSKGTLVVAAKFTGALATSGLPAIASLYDDANNQVSWYYNVASATLMASVIGRSTSVVDTSSTFTLAPVLNQVYRLAVSWDTSTGYIGFQAHNGSSFSTVVSSTLALMPVFNILGIGTSPVATTLGSQEYRQVSLYNTVVPAASLYQLIAA